VVKAHERPGTHLRFDYSRQQSGPFLSPDQLAPTAVGIGKSQGHRRAHLSLYRFSLVRLQSDDAQAADVNNLLRILEPAFSGTHHLLKLEYSGQRHQ